MDSVIDIPDKNAIYINSDKVTSLLSEYYSIKEHTNIDIKAELKQNFAHINNKDTPKFFIEKDNQGTPTIEQINESVVINAIANYLQKDKSNIKYTPNNSKIYVEKLIHDEPVLVPIKDSEVLEAIINHFGINSYNFIKYNPNNYIKFYYERYIQGEKLIVFLKDSEVVEVLKKHLSNKGLDYINYIPLAKINKHNNKITDYNDFTFAGIIIQYKQKDKGLTRKS